MLDWLNEQESLRDATRAIVAEASRLDIAVAFWGADPLERLPLSVQRVPATRIIANVQSGGTNPAAIRDLLQEYGSDRVRQLNDLHAKVFLSDNHLIVGSANVSTNGLGLEGNEQYGWREACVRTDNPGMLVAARTWFDAQWNASASIEEADLVMTEEVWRRARQMRPLSQPPKDDGKDGLLAYALETLQGRRLFIDVTSENRSPKAEKALARVRKNDPTVDGYEDWPAIPLDATLLAFGLDVLKNGKFKAWWDGFWETPADKKARKANTVDGLTLVRQPRPERALPIAKQERSAWTRDVNRLCQAFVDNPRLLPKGQTWGRWCVPIEEAWMHLNGLTPPPNLPVVAGRESPSSTEVEKLLATITDEALRAAIHDVAAERSTFQTTDVIRQITKGYLRDRGTPASESPNAKFGRRLSRDRTKLGIRLVAINEGVRDDDSGHSQTARWERET